MGNQSLEKISLNSGEKASHLTPLEDFDSKELHTAVVQIWNDETQGFDRVTRIRLEDDTNVPEQRKRLLTIALGTKACSQIIARVEDQTVNIFPIRVPKPHLTYNKISLGPESDSDS